ncbi:MAG: 30S ribosomal protein S2 [Candidatus Neomarinimicrobiota bacterium]|jgi:small subunit ribosomal protein S2|nr:30S ribosomal protein S2 [Candidatus Neomarinimicrobiota bacterium]MDD3965986.1 30S ribosomal protein S2 [Candidatus Neomarinimicrobiota bacterium]MDD4960974.1 30S ribosomal protein S2 [Candidatus Neomarinimicrobiota bacterium]MDD5710108.1 30S ribosomal protein S2 [Candidatus Neomarinimicrobiota bacterium]
MEQVTIESLISAGAHFGHLTSKWNPKMKKYVFMEKNGIHIIDLELTLKALEKACKFIGDVVRNGGEILFVGTKKQAKNVLEDEAIRSGAHYITERWLGGELTNFTTIRRSIRRLEQLQRDSESEEAWKNLTKKEVLGLRREREKLETLHRGIQNMRRLPDAIVVVDTVEEKIAVAEARKLDIPVIGILDTNADPALIDYPIPANDDSIRAIHLITKTLADAILEGKRGAKKPFKEKMSDEKPSLKEQKETDNNEVEDTE